MKRGLKIKSYLGISVALFICWIYLFETLDYKANPLEFEMVYHIGSEGVEWKYQSGQNFITWNIGEIVLGALYITASLFYLLKFKENRVLKIALLSVEISWLIWVVWSFYSWYLTGFDH